MADNSEALLKALLTTVGRQAFPADKLAEILLVGGAGAKQIKAYNLCDGTRTQTEVAKSAGLDSGNFSRTVSRWISAGVIFKLSSDKEDKLMHVCPVNVDMSKKKVKKNG
jgi:hypothetical protein